MSITEYVSTTTLTVNGGVHRELEGYQRTLENLGFKVRYEEEMVHYEPAQVLSAEKGNVVLRANCYLKGGKDFSLCLKRNGYEKKVPISIYSLQHAISMAEAIQATVR